MTRTGFAALGLLGVCLALGSVAAAEPASPPRATRLFGFEREEMERLGGRLTEKDGTLTWRPPRGYPVDFPGIVNTDRTEGQWARRMDLSGGWFAAELKSGKPIARFNLFRHAMFRTSGWHARALPTDWSTHAKLLIDAKSTRAQATLEVLVEDERTDYPLSRQYQLPAGQWVTVEFDLAGAASVRRLDPAHIASIYVLVTSIADLTELYIDNIRLSQAQPDGPCPTVSDRSPWPAPSEPANLSRRATRPVSAAARPALPATQPENFTRPVIVPVKPGSYGPLHKLARGIAACGDRHMALMTCAGPGVCLSASDDAGRTWKGIAGGDSTALAGGNNTGNRHGADVAESEILVLYLVHCAGGGGPSELYFRRLSFDGQRWQDHGQSLADREVRHCPEIIDIIRIPSGRIWAAWDHLDRGGITQVAAKFSDDDGKTWQHGGADGLIAPCRLDSNPQLASVGPGDIACFWSSGQDRQKRVLWSRFDQAGYDRMVEDFFRQPTDRRWGWHHFARRSCWSTPEPLPGGTMVLSALGLPDGQVLAAVGKPDAIFAFDGKQWRQETDKLTGRLTRSGKNIYCVQVVRQVGLTWSARGPAGWTEPQVIVEEASAITGLAAPRESPVGFVPLAFSVQGETSVRVIRLATTGLGRQSQ